MAASAKRHCAVPAGGGPPAQYRGKAGEGTDHRGQDDRPERCGLPGGANLVRDPARQYGDVRRLGDDGH